MSAWICPSCSRRVPARLMTCRCGFERDAALVTSSEADERASEPSAPASRGAFALARTLTGATLVVALVAVVATRVYRPVTTANPSALLPPTPPVAPASTTPDASAPRQPERSEVAITEPPATEVITMPPAAPSVTTTSVETTAALEDVISSATPAVVSIETSQGRGSGFFVGPGAIITNNHVVSGNVSVMVRMSNGSTISGRVERTSTEIDLAIVHVDPVPNQPVLQLGSVANVRVGQEVIAIGLAMGQFQGTVTRGIISALRRTGTDSRVVLLQTDAAINPGNSGGPLIDRTGKVVGITTLKVTGTAESLGFAVAADHARAFLTGGSYQAPNVAPNAPTSSPLAPAFSGRSDADLQREQGLQQFDQSLRSVAARASQVDDYWKQIKRDCGGRLTGVYDREWFALWDNRLSINSSDYGCVSALNTVRQEGDQMRAAMTTLNENARRAGVYPGDLRQVRVKYHLDWDGWNR